MTGHQPAASMMWISVNQMVDCWRAQGSHRVSLSHMCKGRLKGWHAAILLFVLSQQWLMSIRPWHMKLGPPSWNLCCDKLLKLGDSQPLRRIPLFALLMACLNFLRLNCWCSPKKNSGEELQWGQYVKVEDQRVAWLLPASAEPTQVAATEAILPVSTTGDTGATHGTTLGPSRILPDCQRPGAPGTSSVVERMGLSQTTVPDNATPSVSPAVVRPKMLAKYDGNTSWADYLVQFNIAARLNSWDDSQKAMELATSLEGNSRAILADLSPDQQLNFEALVGKLTQRFEPEGQQGIYQSQLQSRKRKRSESIPELIQEISRLVRKACPAADEQTRSNMAVSSFISALGNEAQELFVYQKDPKNLEEAGRAALSFETFHAARAKDVPMVRAQHVESSSSDPPKWALDLMVKMEKQLSNWNRKPGKGRGASPETGNSRAWRLGSCYHCRVSGHWARECPQKGTTVLLPSPVESEQSGSNFTETGQQASQSPGPQKRKTRWSCCWGPGVCSLWIIWADWRSPNTLWWFGTAGEKGINAGIRCTREYTGNHWWENSQSAEWEYEDAAPNCFGRHRGVPSCRPYPPTNLDWGSECLASRRWPQYCP